MSITRRQFAARFVNLGRPMLGQLADMYGIDIDIADQWASAIEREQDQQIAGAGNLSPVRVGNAGESDPSGNSSGLSPAHTSSGSIAAVTQAQGA